MTESKINDLLSKMSLEEKIGQLNQYFAFDKFNPEVILQGPGRFGHQRRGRPDRQRRERILHRG